MFKKNIVVWKLDIHLGDNTRFVCLRRTLLYGNHPIQLNTIVFSQLMFKKNIVVWKQKSSHLQIGGLSNPHKFKKNIVVWKHAIIIIHECIFTISLRRTLLYGNLLVII